ncbi:MAG TPA: ribose-5-phosphate isomerase, partial [Nitrospirae bacterium]|nr:ribose-5-phosphate isomerase [Nitrospirota bacterium]
MMKVAIGCDHAGMAMKNQIIPLLEELNVEI